MRNLILTALVALLVVPIASAQDQWSYDMSLTTKGTSGHGIAVDPDGKIWWQPFSATDSVQVNDIDGAWYSTRVIYVFNPDGTEAAISPIKYVDIPGGQRDTLGGLVELDANGAKVWEGKSGRGLKADDDGNIIVTQWVYTYRINYQTGAGMSRTTAGIDATFCSGTAAAVAKDNGRVFIAPVCPGDPIVELDKDFSVLGNAVDAAVGFARNFEVSADGNTIYWAGYTNRAVIMYQRPDEFSAFDSLGVVVPGVSSESFGWQPNTGWLWVGSGSPNDPPNTYDGVTTTWENQAHYAFDPADFVVDQVPTPKAFFVWNLDGAGAGEGRPRGVAFSPDGTKAYTTQFSQTGTEQVQVFSAMPTDVEKLDSTVPDKFILMQAYPNPFNPTTNIQFMLHEAGQAKLAVYDMTGREVAVLADQNMAPGTYQYTFDANGLSSGVYLYRLQFNGQWATGRVTLLK